MLVQIDKRQHNNIVVQASFHGIKLPLKSGEPAKPIEVSESEAQAVQKALNEAKARKRRG